MAPVSLFLGLVGLTLSPPCMEPPFQEVVPVVPQELLTRSAVPREPVETLQDDGQAGVPGISPQARRLCPA